MTRLVLAVTLALAAALTAVGGVHAGPNLAPPPPPLHVIHAADISMCNECYE